MIDLGYVVSAIVPVILLAIFKDNLEPVWRLSLGLGIVPPLSVLYCKFQRNLHAFITFPKVNKIVSPYFRANSPTQDGRFQELS